MDTNHQLIVSHAILPSSEYNSSKTVTNLVMADNKQKENKDEIENAHDTLDRNGSSISTELLSIGDHLMPPTTSDDSDVDNIRMY